MKRTRVVEYVDNVGRVPSRCSRWYRIRFLSLHRYTHNQPFNDLGSLLQTLLNIRLIRRISSSEFNLQSGSEELQSVVEPIRRDMLRVWCSAKLNSRRPLVIDSD